MHEVAQSCFEPMAVDHGVDCGKGLEHVEDFSVSEKAALAWTEALTVLDQRTDYAVLRASLRDHFSEEQIGALTAEVAMINLWNRIQVSNH